MRFVLYLNGRADPEIQTWRVSQNVNQKRKATNSSGCQYKYLPKNCQEKNWRFLKKNKKRFLAMAKKF